MSRSRLLLSGIVAIAVVVAWTLRFGCDDAFISYQYSKSLVHGDGLTWFGDPIEGYTNFAWVLWVAGGLAVGADPLVWAWVGSLVSLGFVLVGTYQIVRTRGNSEVVALCATGLVAVNFTVLAYGTSGLETMLQTALLTFATLHCERLRRETPTPRRLAILSLLASLALWTRLDSAVACAVLAAVTVHRLVRARASRAVWLAAIAPAAILVGGWLAWKQWYYGDLLPNTFHAKVGVTALTLGNGVSFVWDFLWAYGLWPFLIIAIAAAIVTRRFSAWLSGAIALAWFGYVIAVGGDFMEFRFFVPIMPALASVIAEAVTSDVTSSTRVPNARLRAAATVAVALAGSWNHGRHFRGTSADKTYDSIRMLGNFYGLVPDGKNWDRMGTALHDALGSTQATLACNGVGAIPYFSDLPTVDQLGLTDAWVARNGVRPAEDYLRPGHQRYATYDYLVSRKVTFVIGTPTLMTRGQLTNTRLLGNVSEWVVHFLGPAKQTIPVLDLVAIPISNQQSLLLWYLTPTDEVTELIHARGWERRRLVMTRR